MKVSKGQGISLFAAFALFGVFNTIVFIAPLEHTVAFWLGYFFELFALTTVSLILVLHFGKSFKEDKFLHLPAVKTAWIYFVLQTVLSLCEMTVSAFAYMPALIINLVLGAVFAIVILALYAASSKIGNAEAYTDEKVIFIKQLKLKLDSIETNDPELAKKIKELAESVRFSDPMSPSKLVEIESELSNAVDALAKNASNIENALTLCEQAADLLKKRNEQCKIYKGVKDPVAAQAQKSSNGLGIAFAGVSVMLAMFLVAITVCFVIVPQVRYNDAVALMEKEKYDEAVAIFTELGEYKDCEEKIEEVRIILLDKQYDAAVALLNAEKYDEATAVFTELGDHRDSKAKIEEIKIILLDNQYAEAENLFDSGKYAEAINIYTALGDYKESKLRIEQIYNRLSKGDILYFGTYNKEPIAWKILKTESSKMLLITENPIVQKPFHDEIKNVTWETSWLRSWLSSEFALSFSAEQQYQILETDTGDTTDKLFLLDMEEITELVEDESITFKTTEEWWTRTVTETGVVYVASSGLVETEGDQIVRDKGVRPAIWISLE